MGMCRRMCPNRGTPPITPPKKKQTNTRIIRGFPSAGVSLKPTSDGDRASNKQTNKQASKQASKQAKPSQAKPSQAKPSQAKPSQAKPSQAKPSQAKPHKHKQKAQAQAQAHAQAQEQAQTQTHTHTNTRTHTHTYFPTCSNPMNAGINHQLVPSFRPFDPDGSHVPDGLTASLAALAPAVALAQIS